VSPLVDSFAVSLSIRRHLRPINPLLKSTICPAHAGTYTRTATPHLEYASPEDVAAEADGQLSSAVDCMTDVWALGVIAYELLTHRRAFPQEPSTAGAKSRLIGREPLPWELDGSRRDTEVDKTLDLLGPWRPSVLQCLERESVRRPQSAWLAATWGALAAKSGKEAPAKGLSLDESKSLPRLGSNVAPPHLVRSVSHLDQGP
jgi:serine/threonine protein kinase